MVTTMTFSPVVAPSAASSFSSSVLGDTNIPSDFGIAASIDLLQHHCTLGADESNNCETIICIARVSLPQDGSWTTVASSIVTA